VVNFPALNWTGDGQILVSEDHRIVRMTPDGTNSTTLVSDPATIIGSPAACASGRFVVFDWTFHGTADATNIWRMDADGSNLKQLTDGKRDYSPACTPDGKWAYFLDGTLGRLMRVSTDGGRSEVVPGPNRSDISAWLPAISPDGQTLAYLADVGTSTTVRKLVLTDLTAKARSAPRLLPVNPRAAGYSLEFTPDGKSVAYVIQHNNADNLWVQPLDGSKGRQITNFTSQRIDNFHWSPDGKTLALFRVETRSDVVLFHDTTSASSSQ
jgi:Tol biopolymer transport system component